MMKAFKFIALFIALCASALTAGAQGRFMNDKLLNRPYADLRPWHLGFSVGLHAQGISFTHTGYVTPQGSQWMIEQPSYAPGFCVNGLFDLRLGSNFSLRLSPGLYFGNRSLRMLDLATGAVDRQSLKSTFVVLPIDIKYSARRLGNMRPYVVGGVMPAFDVSKRQSELIQLKSADTYLCIGFGSDFYLPYFKLVPEVKFCFGLADVLQLDRPDLEEDPYKQAFTRSVKKATSKMIVLTFYFE